MVEKLIYEGLYDFEIKEMLANDVDIIRYENLSSFNKIDELFKNSENIVLLYQTKENEGHWVCMWRTKKKIFFFDSYGGTPDSQLKYAKYNHNRLHSYLLKLMYDSSYLIDYNDYELQGNYPISTCGRWCVERLKNKGLSTKAFGNTFFDISEKTGFSPDYIVTILNISQ
jgi:hypothetical protein